MERKDGKERGNKKNGLKIKCSKTKKTKEK